MRCEDKKFHFLSGLPRSGSTLLAAILQQNPRFTAGMTSPVFQSYTALEASMSQKTADSITITDQQRENVLRGLFHNFYADNTGVVFDNSRLWNARLPALSKLFPSAKVIACVRDVAWIVDSFERLYRKNPFEPSGIYNYETSGTVYSRSGSIAAGDGVVGFALNALKEALFGENAGNLLLVEYDNLCYGPGKTMERIYDFIEEPLFLHDFKNVKYSASDFDRVLGAKGLHDVRSVVEPSVRRTILPPDIFARYAHDQFWRNPPNKLSMVKS